MPRKNSLDAMTRWHHGQRSTASQMGKSIWTDGRTLWSYSTPLAVRCAAGIAVNATKYSSTTSTHQKALDAFLASELPGYTVVRVGGIDRGVPSVILANAARL